jgi:hypothetical protein
MLIPVTATIDNSHLTNLAKIEILKKKTTEVVLLNLGHQRRVRQEGRDVFLLVVDRMVMHQGGF